MNHNETRGNISDNETCTVYLSNGTIVALDMTYVVILLVGLVGNVMTCTATIIQKSMRRSIHIYVFNLAVCDLLILTIYIPNEMMRMSNGMALFLWGPVMCVAMSLVLPVAVNSTVFTLLAISVDRARSVLQPFEWRADSQGSARVVVPIIWVISVSIAAPVMVHSKLIPFNCGLVCAEISWPNATRYWYVMFGLTFIIPLLIILVLHALMFYKVNYELVSSPDRRDDNRMTRMIIIIVLIFTVCTGSQHFYFFISQFTNIEQDDPSTDAILFFGSNMLVTVQSACNPIIYGTFREDFNVAYRRIMKRVGTVLRRVTLLYTNVDQYVACAATTTGTTTSSSAV